jgi:hypothetical protein
MNPGKSRKISKQKIIHSFIDTAPEVQIVVELVLVLVPRKFWDPQRI